MFRFFEQNYSYEEVFESLNNASRPRIDFYVLMILATLICTFGLLLNNPAVIIGAMLIAPMMEPILGLSFSSLTRNVSFVFRSGFTLATGIFLAVFLSALFCLPFSSLSISDEVLSRTHPSLLDLFVALGTGLVAGYAKVRRHVGGTIYGVAISISLVPPLCVMGIGLANLRSDIYLGAALLFSTNLVSIVFSGALTFLLLRLEQYRKSMKALILSGASLLFLAVPLSFSLIAIQQKKTLEIELNQILRRQTHTFRQVEILDIKTNTYSNPIKIDITVRGQTGIITPRQVALVETLLSHNTGTPVRLTVNLMPSIQIRSEAQTLPIESLRPNRAF